VASLIPYDRYTELLGKRIHRTITPAANVGSSFVRCLRGLS